MAKKAYNKKDGDTDINKANKKTYPKNPSKTLFGKIVIVVIALSMVIIPIISLIIVLFNQ